MRKRLGNPIWRSFGGCALALLALLTAGCNRPVGEKAMVGSYDIPLESTPWEGKTRTPREMALAQWSDFSMELVRFVDARRPRTLEMEPNDKVIYEYDPNILLQGVTYRVPALVQRYISYRPKTAKHYKLEMELTKLNALIRTGTLASGSWGRYAADLDMVALVRRPDSTVALYKHYFVKLEKPRKSLTGRAPSKEYDRAQTFALVEDAVRKISENVRWDLYKGDASDWEVKATPAPKVRVAPKNEVQPLVVPGVPVR